MDFIFLNEGNDLLNPIAKADSAKAEKNAFCPERCKERAYRCSTSSVGYVPQNDGARI